MKKNILVLLVLFVCFSVFALSIDDFNESAHAGTRKDPIPLLDGYCTVKIRDKWSSKEIAEVDVAVSKVLRGKSANRLVELFSDLNPKPAFGKEYAFVLVHVRNRKDLTGKDEPVKIDFNSFLVVDKDFNRTAIEYVMMPEQLDAEVYEDGKAEGYITCQVKTDEMFYLQIGGVWFSSDPASDTVEQ